MEHFHVMSTGMGPAPLGGRGTANGLAEAPGTIRVSKEERLRVRTRVDQRTALILLPIYACLSYMHIGQPRFAASFHH